MSGVDIRFPGWDGTTDPATVPVRFSNLKRLAQSPLHYWHAVQRHDETSDSLATRLGTAVHALLLGQPLAVYRGAVRRGAQWEAFQAQHPNVPIVNEREEIEAKRIGRSLHQHSLAPSLLYGDGIFHERSVSAELDGLRIQGRIDAHGPCHVVDLKTTRNAEPNKFARDAQWRGYHAQLAWYGDLLEAAGLARVTDYWIVAVESAPPYAVTVLRLSPNTVDLGRRQYRAWWERLRVCLDSGRWPGYVEGAHEWDLVENVELLLGDDNDNETETT